MTQDQALGLIKAERTYQDSTYQPDETLTSGQTRSERDKDVTAHLVLLDIYLDKAKQAWNLKGSNTPALKQIAKIAAIATRALERAGGADVLLTEGLR